MIEESSKQFMSCGEYVFSGRDVLLSEKQDNESNQKWEEVKLDGDWMKLKQTKRGRFLHVSEDGEKLTIEEDSEGMLHFI